MQIVFLWCSLETHIIYNSFDFNTKLSHHIFTDSKVGSKLSCGRTKAKALVTNVLAPLNAADFLETL
jgi:hypothetical protein